MSRTIANNPIVLGGHFGFGIQIVGHFGSCHDIRYGRVNKNNQTIENPDYEIKDISKEDLIRLAAQLLAVSVKS